MNVNDIALVLLLSAMIPLMVSYYLPRHLFSAKFRMMVTVGGILWMLYALVWDTLSLEVLGVAKKDAMAHWYVGKRIAEQMAAGSWTPLWNNFRLGNGAYQCYVAIIHYFTGTTDTFMAAGNGWFSFWGGLALVSSLRRTYPHSDFSSGWYVTLIFCPSVVYWSTMNVKEGLMYWAICMVFSSTSDTGSLRWLKGTPMLVAGMAVGGILRPHIMIVWIGAVLVVELVKKRQFWFAILSGIAFLGAIQAFTGMHGLESSFDQATQFGEMRSKILSATQGKSNIDYGAGGPVVFVSGFISLFFRPFPWEMTSLRLLLSCLETWIITCFVFTGLWSGLRSRSAPIGHLPQIQVALIATLGFCLFFTYTPNEGIVARQRIQALPALLAMAVLPRSARQEQKYRRDAFKWMLAQTHVKKEPPLKALK